LRIDTVTDTAEDQMRVMQFSATRVRLRYAAIAGVAVIVAVLLMTMRPVNETPQPVRAVPTERLSKAEEFAWESPFAAERYRVTLRDDAAVIFSGEISQSPFLPDRALRSLLRPGQKYSWKVESLDATGTVIAESVPIAFVYEP
jgi:hypothetical protein